MKKEPLVVLITPTGGRSRQIQLCAKWMKAQTYKGKVLWVIVDDCVPQTTAFISYDFRKNWSVITHTPTPTWQEGQNTQSRNIQAGLDFVPRNNNVIGIFIIEDDDYYKATYIETMLEELHGFDLCGETCSVYYNTSINAIKRHNNCNHSSLFQTAFTVDVIPYLEKILEKNHKFIDIELFKSPVSINLFSHDDLAIGIKGMEGRTGIGRGHDSSFYFTQTKVTLADLIGTDSIHYIKN